MADVDTRTAPRLPATQRAAAILPVAGTLGAGVQMMPLSDVITGAEAIALVDAVLGTGWKTAGISAADARALIATWARASGASGTVPDGRIPAGIARLAGAIFGGAVEVPTPTVDAHAATKGYVDANAGTGTGTGGVLDVDTDPVASDANRVTIIVGDGQARIVEITRETNANASADFADYADDDYLFTRNNEPSPTSYAVGKFYFNRISHLLREVYRNSFSQKRWQDKAWNTALVTGARYRGVFGSDDIAVDHLHNSGDVYYNSNTLLLRVASNLVAAGTVNITYRLVRLARADEAALLAGATFAGATGGIAPVADTDFAIKSYVDGLRPLPPTSVHRTAISVNATLSEAEVLAGTTSADGNFLVPTWSGGRRFIFLCVLEDENDIVSISTGGIDVFGVFERVTGTIMVDSLSYKCWKTISDQSDAASGITYVAMLGT